MHDEARRLVDDEQVLVLVGDGEGRAGAIGAGAGGGSSPPSSSTTRSPAASRWRLGTGAPSTVTRPSSIRRAARDREPSGAARKASSRAPAVVRSARGARIVALQDDQQQQHAERDRRVGQVEGGQCGSLTKSVTAPSRTRSTTLPTAPPTSIPVGSHTSGRSRVAHEEHEQGAQRDGDDEGDDHAAAAERAEGHAVVVDAHEVDEGDEVAPLPPTRSPRTSAFVSWSRATTTSAVSAASAQPLARERARTALSPGSG